MPLVDHPLGNYRFLPGIAPYSCGVVAAPGFEIVHVTLQRPETYRKGFDRIAAHLSAVKRPKAALCAIALRSPKPFRFEGFAAFNGEYTTILKEWGLFVEGVNPVARTNVAPRFSPPSEPVLYSFAYTRPASGEFGPTFVVAGAGELPEGVLRAEEIVARGDTSSAGLAIKARFVMELMETRLLGLGGAWSQVTTINAYTHHSLTTVLADLLMPRIGADSSHGVTWHYSQPPIEEIEFEMDLRGVQTELHLP